MNKKIFTPPFIFLTAAELNDGSGIGSNVGGDGLNSIRPIPISFAEWAQSRWCADYDESGEVTIDDFARWWAQSGLGLDSWAQFNPGVAWKDEWSK